jgi:hypothetical protein
MNKKQQMRWSRTIVQSFLDVRTPLAVVKSPPIGGLDRVGVGRWLTAMEEDFAPVGTWLP